VDYDAGGFLEKNRDRLAGEVIALLRASRLDLVRALFNSSIAKLGSYCKYCDVTIILGPRQTFATGPSPHNSGHFGPPLPFWSTGPPALPGLPMASYATE